MISIVPESPSHLAAREALLDAAFGPSRFAKTCERLREDRQPAEGLAFAMQDGDRLVGTLRLWNVSAGPGRPALLLGPLAIDASRRSHGLGRALMEHSLAAAASLGHGAVLLVGDAPYYARFGFSQEKAGRLWLPGPYERERFLGLDLVDGMLEGASGLVNPTGRFVETPVAWPLAA
jgi:predicted N-acetyltransferase YhbS